MKYTERIIYILVICTIIYLLIEHINRRTYAIIDEIERRGSHSIDNIEKRTYQLLNITLFKFDHQITEHLNTIVDKSRKYIPLQNPYGATTCTEWFGCHRGYCWAGCAGAFPSVTGPEWCYTKKSNGKIICSEDLDCDGCWRCASPCTI